VTLLVAQGLSNREVAAELYVSPKTVQYHLTRIYAKVGVRSRAELAAVRR
jgi:DNA-binding CsgD family transcriptional regulator